jgi:hypothetical protein
MNKLVADLKPETEVVDPLALLRRPFPANQISKLPKPTKAQTDEVKVDFKKGIRCGECGAWHHPNVVHLDYVGHAAITDRLLEADPCWSWEPVAFGPDGLPAFDKTGGLWIKLTVGGVTRLGYGHADPKPNQDLGAREKEVIGDALRNAGMRFGMALDLWHKGDLHAPEQTEPTATAEELAINHLRSCAIDKATFVECWAKNKGGWKDVLSDDAYARVVAEMKRLAAQIAEKEEAARPKPEPAAAPDFGIGDDEIPEFN